MRATKKYAEAGGTPATGPGGLTQDELVLRHADLVKRIAYHLVSRMPPSVEVDDLIQAGMLGLLDAARHYTPSKGANFETYAGIRIRGAMLDEEGLRAHTRERLAAYKLPKRVFAVPAMFRAPNGKADYKTAQEFAARSY